MSEEDKQITVSAPDTVQSNVSETAENVKADEKQAEKSDVSKETKETDAKESSQPQIDTNAMVAAIAKRKAKKLAERQNNELRSKIDALTAEIESLKNSQKSTIQPSYGGQAHNQYGDVLIHPETGQPMDSNLTLGEYVRLEAERQALASQGRPTNHLAYSKVNPMQQQQPQQQSATRATSGQLPVINVSDDFLAQAEWCAEHAKGERAGDDFVSVMRNQVSRIADAEMLNAAAYASPNGALDIYELARTAEGFKKLAEIASIEQPERKKFAMYELIKARDRQRQSLYTSNATPQPRPLETGGKLDNYFYETASESYKRRTGK